MSTSGQVEPPGMHMIYLPYSDDVRPVEEVGSMFKFLNRILNRIKMLALRNLMESCSFILIQMPWHLEQLMTKLRVPLH